MLSLRQYLEQEGVSLSEFARRLTKRLDRAVAPQNVFRWTRPFTHRDYAVPEQGAVVAIYAETAGLVQPNSFYPLPRLNGRVNGHRRKAA